MVASHKFPELALDVAVSLVIANVAALFADFALQFVTPNAHWMYTFWFAFGLLPLAFYARHRGIVQFDRWDLLYWLPFPMVIGLISEFVGHGPEAIFAIGVLVPAYAGLQTKIIGKRADTFQPDKQVSGD